MSMWEARFIEKPATHANFARSTHKDATCDEEGDEENVTACVLVSGSFRDLFVGGGGYIKDAEDFDSFCQKRNPSHRVFNNGRLEIDRLELWSVVFENLLDLLCAVSKTECCLVWERVKRYYIEIEKALNERIEESMQAEEEKRKSDEAAEEEKWKSEVKNLMEVIKTRKGKIPTREGEEKDPKAKQAAKFVTQQRALWHSDPDIDYDRMFELSEIPNWTWSQSEETWQAQFQNLRDVLKKQKGKLPSQDAGEKDPKVKKAARFINNQRMLHQKGELESDRVELLSEIDNWTWTDNAPHESWEAQYRNLLEVMKKHKGRLPSQSTVEKNPKMKAAARFVNNQRTLCKQGKLSDSRAEKLSAIENWTWTDTSIDQLWEAQLKNLREVMHKRHGKLPSRSAREKDAKVQQAAWFVSNQRRLYKQGKLSDSQKAKLCELDNWTWNATSTDQRTAVKRLAAALSSAKGSAVKRPAKKKLAHK